MKRIITAITLSALLLSSVCGLYASAAGTKENIKIGQVEETEEVPQFCFTDENGNITEIVDFEYVGTYSLDVEGVSTQAFEEPDPDTNFYDLSQGGEYRYSSNKKQSVYEMDKWFHANSKGWLYLGARVVDADGKLLLYTRREKEGICNIKIYSMDINTNNPRTRYRTTGCIMGLDKTGAKYYTASVEAISGQFTYGVLKASWSEIEDVFD